MDLWTRFQGPDINEDEFWLEEEIEVSPEFDGDLGEFLVPVDEDKGEQGDQENEFD